MDSSEGGAAAAAAAAPNGGLVNAGCGGDFPFYSEMLPPELARQLMMGENLI